MTITDADFQHVLQRLATVEARLAALEGGAPAPAGPISIDGEPAGAVGGQPSAEAIALAQNGKLINAIKLHREQTGVDLASAKAALERYAR